ncbi:hypothetical protein M378DRAFT_162338 [Amanita muscaria Koide BX008]|uniref:F-box domain-containing protein n=1 Tax=Amanita muscaria (strain Koide BX008) TaxID=946122 RepID=A0A0C2WTP2_AMAMK|nr:hypothetical protein M378DRAFT_162338 [Amanita muscaria Koide BX008]
MWQYLYPELVFEVFSHFLPGLRLIASESDSFPWYLGHICRGWRSVFTTTPEFWSTIRIDFDYDIFSGNWSTSRKALTVVDRTATLVALCMERGKDHPLLLEFITGIRDSRNFDAAGSPPKRYVEILDMLVAHSARWWEARIVLDAREIPALHKAKGYFPQLYALQLLVSNSETCPSLPFPNPFEHAQQLSRISLSNVSTWHFKWSAMKAIEIHPPGAITFQDIIDALRETKCLEKLVIHQSIPYDISDMLHDIKPVTLPSLTILYIEGATVLPFILSPSLRCLWIQNGYHNYEKYYSKESFHTHVAAFFRPLQHLRFMMLAPWSGKDARIFLQCMPRVDHLCLVTRLVDVLKSLAMTCPNALHLQELSLELSEFCPHALHEAGSILATMLKDNGERRMQRIDVVSTQMSTIGNSPRDISSPSFIQLKYICEELGIRLATLSIWAHTYDLVRTSASYPKIISL